MGSMRLCTALQWSAPLPPSSPPPSFPLTCCCLSFVRTFVALHRSCILKLSAPKTAAASASAAQWDWGGQTQCARSADCGIIYYARNLIHVTYSLLNAPSERSKATQESETETEIETEKEKETETETESESESVSELESEQLVGVCSRLVKLVNLLMTHARGRQQERERERERELTVAVPWCGSSFNTNTSTKAENTPSKGRGQH